MFLLGDPPDYEQLPENALGAQARERKSYTIHTPDGQGDYVPAADPVSAALRERVSREGGG